MLLPNELFIWMYDLSNQFKHLSFSIELHIGHLTEPENVSLRSYSISTKISTDTFVT